MSRRGRAERSVNAIKSQEIKIIKDKYMGKTSIEGNKYRGQRATSIEGKRQ
jgi:hypothetical protein